MKRIAPFIVTLAALSPSVLRADDDAPSRPNVILCMTDDLGWGDTGYNGNRIIKTPHLDAMSREGLQFNRFYSGAPVCSPTRGSCLTGRHPYRYGIVFANRGHMKEEEVTLAEVLRSRGYRTGHFGKWHLGTLTTSVRESNRGGSRSEAHFSPPWRNGFDVCFSTEAKVPTWDPMKKPKAGGSGKGWDALKKGEAFDHYGTHYWNEREEMVTENLEGDDSRVIMDRALPFIREAVEAKRPFLAVIWFHAPHLPVVTGPKYASMYSEHPQYPRNYYGCVTAMDSQLGRLREELRNLGVEKNTQLWFTSDNGPEGKENAPGSAGPFRGRKRSLYEGGVRVPGLLVWPAKIKGHRETDIPCSTSDYFPTVLDALGLRPESQRPHDGISLLPLIEGTLEKRPAPIGFQSGNQVSLTDNRYKLIRPRANRPFELYDLVDDPAETRDLAEKHPETVARMKAELLAWQESCSRSAAGADYSK